jgi:hypothetical protein
MAALDGMWLGLRKQAQRFLWIPELRTNQAPKITPAKTNAISISWPLPPFRKNFVSFFFTNTSSAL